MSDLSGGQIIGIIVGALIGYIIAGMRSGVSYLHVGGGWFEVIDESEGCLRGCLSVIFWVALGIAAGFLIGGALIG